MIFHIEKTYSGSGVFNVTHLEKEFKSKEDAEKWCKEESWEDSFPTEVFVNYRLERYQP